MTTKRILSIIGLSIVAILLLVAVFTSWYTVDESEQAVIITFGEAGEPVTESGLHFKMPWPIQKAEVMSKETYSLQFGYDQNEDGEVTAYDKETKMITGDENIVLTDLVVQWKITDPKKFLFNAEDPREMLHDATSASIRSIIGSSLIDDALTSGKAEIEAETRDLLSSLIEEYDIGISVLAVKLQDVELPNEEVRAAFTNVTDARETMNTKINEANKYENQKRNEALGEKSAINSRAEAQKVERVEQATGDVAVFDKLYAEYEGNPEVTRQRLIMETLESVLPNAKLYIMNDDEGTMKYLPLGEMQTAIPPVAEEETEEGGGN
ncbi:FtsH protease activity modulator HflK [Planococcus sp. CP5-4]|uniref:FtsH protease activity modulator HflK n=1 Tax=unclassified Planococcus (in: firmicutes) TaxID=2662419 RepID=UPI001C22742F|nr:MULTISPECIES: FtsH protease activity modulator HflK [unclassified Planococcus (in: firmicutes)]MBU9672975.1 FtsH protease activity modulator HflK [Planococcus sp. CP5-4_YE]MBV0908747.1 FtsH protease activity modulator HflK [Planococcus sp. CP5-4_UN]MBW6063516.1 FtsH protease activity modulator HflK [Planococcus sp. CP5-4]